MTDLHDKEKGKKIERNTYIFTRNVRRHSGVLVLTIPKELYLRLPKDTLLQVTVEKI